MRGHRKQYSHYLFPSQM